MNTNALSTFSFAPGMDLRTITKDGEPWFVAKDVCDALGYTNSPDALAKHVDDDNRSPIAIYDGSSQTRRMSCINEPGLYSLIMGSKLPAAKAFKTWVTATVLPAIRKTGGYVMGEEKVKTGELSMEEMTLRVVSFMQTKLTSLEAERLVHIEKLADQQPAVDFVERYVGMEGTSCLRDAAKAINVKPKLLNAALHMDKVLLKPNWNGEVLAAQQYLTQGYFITKQVPLPYGRSTHQTRVTTKGLTWLAKQYGG